MEEFGAYALLPVQPAVRVHHHVLVLGVHRQHASRRGDAFHDAEMCPKSTICLGRVAVVFDVQTLMVLKPPWTSSGTWSTT